VFVLEGQSMGLLYKGLGQAATNNLGPKKKRKKKDILKAEPMGIS